MLVYVLTKTGVYDHGCAGVFGSEQKAREHAKVCWDASDGYHGYRIDELKFDDPVDMTEGVSWMDRKNGREEPPIEVNYLVPKCEAAGCDRPATMTAEWHEAQPDACDEHGKDPMARA